MKVLSIQIASTSGPRTSRSNVSQSATRMSTHSSSSGASIAKLVAKEELVHLSYNISKNNRELKARNLTDKEKKQERTKEENTI